MNYKIKITDDYDINNEYIIIIKEKEYEDR